MTENYTGDNTGVTNIHAHTEYREDVVNQKFRGRKKNLWSKIHIYISNLQEKNREQSARDPEIRKKRGRRRKKIGEIGQLCTRRRKQGYPPFFPSAEQPSTTKHRFSVRKEKLGCWLNSSGRAGCQTPLEIRLRRARAAKPEEGGARQSSEWSCGRYTSRTDNAGQRRRQGRRSSHRVLQFARFPVLVFILAERRGCRNAKHRGICY